MREEAVLGLRAHSGWAALIALTGPVDAPRVLDRQRIELVDAEDPEGRQPYHAAESLPFREAERLITRHIKRSQELASAAVRRQITSIDRQGCSVKRAALLLASGRPLPDLAAILASHALIHTAEGEMFRDVLRNACERCDISVTGVREKELLVRSSSLCQGKATAYLAELGRELGPPWRQDEKYATLAAWMILAEPDNL
jgi:hypothetical protein